VLWLTIGIAAACAIGALIYVIAPLRKPATPLPSEEDDRLADLVERKESVLRAIKETEFDYQTGKLAEEDFKRYDQRLRQQAIALIQQIEKIAPEADALDTQLEAQIARLRKVRTNGAGPKTASKPAAVSSSTATTARARFCHECGTAIAESDKFCSQCGTPVREASAVPSA
jgi:transposase